MRLVADLVRGKDILIAINYLKFNQKQVSKDLEKLLISGLTTGNKRTESRSYSSDLFVKEVKVDGGRMLKRIQPAPQGRTS